MEIINLVLISNITIEIFLKNFFKEKSIKDISLNVKIINREDILDLKCIEWLKEADFICIWLNIEYDITDSFIELSNNKKGIEELKNTIIERYKLFLNSIKSNYRGKIIWIGFEDFYQKENIFLGSTGINNNIVDIINFEFINMNDIIWIDLKRIIAQIGISKIYNYRNKCLWNAPYNKNLAYEVANNICKQILIEKGISKKCIILDCDNVLWGGILSEEGIGNIQLNSSGTGKKYQDFQRFILQLYYHGTILAICSKNELKDVIEVFENHTAMILKKDYISCFKVNWNNKVENIKSISEFLNISLEDIVFIDDMIFEIESVKMLLPEVTTILYDNETIYEKLSCFNLKKEINLENITIRNNTYITNEKRNILRAQYTNYEDYLEMLRLEISIKVTQEEEYTRIAELCQRTNKFTNGIRYTVNQLNKKEKNYELYSVFVKDRFSDLGLVGAVGIDNKELDLFCLSCRALGRKVEDKMLQLIQKKSLEKFRFMSTNKNDQVFKLLESNINTN